MSESPNSNFNEATIPNIHCMTTLWTLDWAAHPELILLTLPVDTTYYVYCYTWVLFGGSMHNYCCGILKLVLHQTRYMSVLHYVNFSYHVILRTFCFMVIFDQRGFLGSRASQTCCSLGVNSCKLDWAFLHRKTIVYFLKTFWQLSVKYLYLSFHK